MRRAGLRMRCAIGRIDVDAVAADVAALRAQGIAADVATEYRRALAHRMRTTAQADLAAAIASAQAVADGDKRRAQATARAMGGAA